MNIIQVGPYPISSDCIRGGVEASVFGLTNEFVRMGQKVEMLDFPRVLVKDAVECDGNLTVHRYENHGAHNRDALVRVQDMVRDILTLHPDVVHVHGTGELSAAIYRAVKRMGTPVMLTIHGLIRVEKRNMIRKAFCHREWKRFMKFVLQYVQQNRAECSLLKEAEQVIVDTDYLVDALKKYPIRHLPEIYVIPQGADERYFKSLAPKPYSAEGGDIIPKILCVGTFSQRKSQVELIRAFELVRSRGIQAELVLCGAVSEQGYYQRVKDAVAVSPYTKDIVIRENLSQEKLLEEYRKATVLALHSQEESQGIVFAEAMAMGLPIVSTKVGGIPYVVADGKTGFLTEYGDVQSTADALEKLLKDKALWKSMSQVALRIAEDYRWRNIAGEILKLYQEK